MARMAFPMGSSHMSYGLYAISDGFGTISKWLLCHALMSLCHFLRFQSCLMNIRQCPMLLLDVLYGISYGPCIMSYAVDANLYGF